MIETHKLEFWDDSLYIIRDDLENRDEVVEELLEEKRKLYESFPKIQQDYFLHHSKIRIGGLTKITKVVMTEDEYLDLFLEIKHILEMRNNYGEENRQKNKTENDPTTIQSGNEIIFHECHNLTN